MVDAQCAILYTKFLTNEYMPYLIQVQLAPRGEPYAKMIDTTYFWYHTECGYVRNNGAISKR